ncbi:hypothetical protein BEP19_13820 [Ammoniphilus oxalaticus]|uniref:Uncharacterized protein n=1 Tax=Ammoniphilus oxalaticus TaxID=66863 RepID=A0A419SED7_9BACL|nr:hypothetical protein [Ammoniphilus oxalaticus]RKD21705.1 hypothetical protein BEP19_13820 [Ammoniphilus oxalaticus]
MLAQTNTETNIKLPFAFIFYSLVAFVLSQVMIIWRGADLLDGAFRQPVIWSAAHLLLLGWALMAAMGSMYQLVPVAFLTPIWSEKFGFFQFAVTSLGITVFSITLAWVPLYAYWGGILTLIGILLFLFQMWMTLKKQTEKSIITLFVGSALFCLFVTIGLGILLALNISGFSILASDGLLKGHILLGLCGWFTLLIFGFSYKMAPMFSLAHGFQMELSRTVFGVYTAGLILSFVSLFNTSHLLLSLGFLLLFVGFLLFSIHMRQVIQKRVKKKLDRPFVFSLIAIGFGLVIHLLAFIYAIAQPTPLAFIVLACAYIIGWIVFSLIGYLIKIVPFLWWTHRYSQQVGKENVPALKDMMDDRLIHPLLIILPVSFAGVIISFPIHSQSLFWTSQTIFTAGSVLFCYIIIMVLKK